MAKKFKSGILNELSWRGLIEQSTHEGELDELLAGESVSLYAGFDPSSTSLTAGNLVPAMALALFARHGHRPIALLGGATGRIGDPSGKAEERALRTVDEIDAQVEAMGKQLERVLARCLEMRPETLGERAQRFSSLTFVNNGDWMLPWSYIDFLRDVGKHFRVNTMIAKDSVRTRLESREQGISYTEFSYMLIQAYDFLHLFEKHDCALQVGGSDQWGNITAGIDLIRRSTGKSAYGLTFPLLLTAGGEKMGKSEKGALWLDGDMTSPYEWYQYWVRCDDVDVNKLLKTFTFLSQEEVAELELEVVEGRNQGQVQRVLAYELTELIHGKEAADKAVAASNVLFGGAIENLTDRDLEAIFADVPSVTLARDALDGGIPMVDLLHEAGSVSSKGEARRLLKQGGAYLNNQRVDGDRTVTGTDLAGETTLVLRSGKKNYRLVKFA